MSVHLPTEIFNIIIDFASSSPLQYLSKEHHAKWMSIARSRPHPDRYLFGKLSAIRVIPYDVKRLCLTFAHGDKESLLYFLHKLSICNDTILTVLALSFDPSICKIQKSRRLDLAKLLLESEYRVTENTKGPMHEVIASLFHDFHYDQNLINLLLSDTSMSENISDMGISGCILLPGSYSKFYRFMITTEYVIHYKTWFQDKPVSSLRLMLAHLSNEDLIHIHNTNYYHGVPIVISSGGVAYIHYMMERGIILPDFNPWECTDICGNRDIDLEVLYQLPPPDLLKAYTIVGGERKMEFIHLALERDTTRLTESIARILISTPNTMISSVLSIPKIKRIVRATIYNCISVADDTILVDCILLSLGRNLPSDIADVVCASSPMAFIRNAKFFRKHGFKFRISTLLMNPDHEQEINLSSIPLDLLETECTLEELQSLINGRAYKVYIPLSIEASRMCIGQRTTPEIMPSFNRQPLHIPSQLPPFPQPPLARNYPEQQPQMRFIPGFNGQPLQPDRPFPSPAEMRTLYNTNNNVPINSIIRFSRPPRHPLDSDSEEDHSSDEENCSSDEE